MISALIYYLLKPLFYILNSEICKCEMTIIWVHTFGVLDRISVYKIVTCNPNYEFINMLNKLLLN